MVYRKIRKWILLIPIIFLFLYLIFSSMPKPKKKNGGGIIDLNNLMLSVLNPNVTYSLYYSASQSNGKLINPYESEMAGSYRADRYKIPYAAGTYVYLFFALDPKTWEVRDLMGKYAPYQIVDNGIWFLIGQEYLPLQFMISRR